MKATCPICSSPTVRRGAFCSAECRNAHRREVYRAEVAAEGRVRDTSRMGGLRLPPAIDRLRASLTHLPNGCQIRTTNCGAKGYSRITVDGKQILCHRLMWEHENGSIPDGMVVMHRCDNPPCCNPEHLTIGSLADNNRDMWAKGRGRLTPPAWRKIPLADHAEIKARLASGESKTSVALTYGVSRQAIGYLARRWAA